MWLQEKPKLSDPPMSRCIKVPLPTPDGPTMTSADGRPFSSSSCSPARCVDCSCPIANMRHGSGTDKSNFQCCRGQRCEPLVTQLTSTYWRSVVVENRHRFTPATAFGACSRMQACNPHGTLSGAQFTTALLTRQCTCSFSTLGHSTSAHCCVRVRRPGAASIRCSCIRKLPREWQRPRSCALAAAPARQCAAVLN